MSRGVYVFPESILEVFLTGWTQGQEMRAAERILSEEAAELVAPPISTEPSLALAPLEEGATEVDPVP
eukprot:11611600-Alexandrium_andersonii.AAC.1